MVYMNTSVTRGSGEFVVTATGMSTEVGHISGLLQAEQAAKRPLTRQLNTLTQQILWIAGVALVISVALNLARGDTFKSVFIAAVAFAVGALICICVALSIIIVSEILEAIQRRTAARPAQEE
jgi:P-type Ca2+ transporter type 2C